MAYNAQQQAVIDEATRRAQANGTTPEREAWNYAQANNMSPLAVDEFFGWGSGTTGKWGVDNGLAPAPQGNYNPGRGGGSSGGGGDIGFVNRKTTPQPAQQPSGGYQGGNLGMDGGYNPQQNPYLKQIGIDVGNQMFDQWSRNTMPSIRSGAMVAGGFGGSRQGVVEANGFNDMNRQYGRALTRMYGNDWSNQQGRNLQQQGINNSYDLGLRSSDLGFSNLDANINQQNFNNNLAGANFGMGVYGMMNGMNQQGINSGTQMQNTPLNYFNQFNGNTNATGGMGGTQTGTQGTTSNGLSQGLGLGLAGGDFLTKYFTAV